MIASLTYCLSLFSFYERMLGRKKGVMRWATEVRESGEMATFGFGIICVFMLSMRGILAVVRYVGRESE